VSGEIYFIGGINNYCGILRAINHWRKEARELCIFLSYIIDSPCAKVWNITSTHQFTYYNYNMSTDYHFVRSSSMPIVTTA